MQKSLLTFTIFTSILLFTSVIFDKDFKPDAQKIAFKNWMTRHSKSYSSHQQFLYRLNVYKQNALFVTQHNSRYAAGLQTFNVELNHFADMSSQQFVSKYTMKSFESGVSKCTGPEPPTNDLPDSIDWVEKGAITQVKNQGQCGACWSFSATGSLQGLNFLNSFNLLSFSEQQLIDCSTSHGNNGCNGGTMNNAFSYLLSNGITTQSQYPYYATQSTCDYTPTQKAFSISNCVDVTPNKQLPLKAAVAQQPVSVGVDAAHSSFQLYKSGIYGGYCGTSINHAVLVVGYGEVSGRGYWRVKNSWGVGWGSAGYMDLVRRGDGKGECGVQVVPSFPIV